MSMFGYYLSSTGGYLLMILQKLGKLNCLIRQYF